MPIGFVESSHGSASSTNLVFNSSHLRKLHISTSRRPLTVQASYSKALAVADSKDLMKRLPKFIYDEEKALEKTRKVLTEKIAQLNAAIDDVSGQLRSEDAPNGVAVNSDEIEAAI
ncbi:hypothetical protein GOBAR_AA19002 [Gossypium barbadense]|uniref:Uncharacterized protein n=1 Tax=Gossypium barbadense TaxID=3634 RepID=A0A2P5XE92_GOSBA|nr:hypothetical protein GOBAR_AA19002 [Gossypium barbadense]